MLPGRQAAGGRDRRVTGAAVGTDVNRVPNEILSFVRGPEKDVQEETVPEVVTSTENRGTRAARLTAVAACGPPVCALRIIGRDRARGLDVGRTVPVRLVAWRGPCWVVSIERSEHYLR